MTASLVSQLEKAGEGSRELDEQIHDLLCASNFRTCIKGMSDEDGGLWMYEFPGHAASSALRVTTSLDAALALAERVLPGASPGVSKNVFHGYWSAWLHRNVEGTCQLAGDACTSPTPALALCIAILKALPNYQEKNNVG